MSKMDNMRAMREARYERITARASQATSTQPAPPPAAPVVRAAPVVPDVLEADPAPGEELCGHRNMSGGTCTRERGHAAKSHRYS